MNDKLSKLLIKIFYNEGLGEFKYNDMHDYIKEENNEGTVTISSDRLTEFGVDSTETGFKVGVDIMQYLQGKEPIFGILKN